jgi:hypothetical protein
MPPHRLKSYQSGSDTIRYCEVCKLEWPLCVGECQGEPKESVDKKVDKETEHS